MQLQSGIFRASGKIDKSDDPYEPLEGDIEVLCAFDFEANLYRFERFYPQHFIDDGKVTLVRRGGRYIDTSDFSIHWVEGGNRQITVHSANEQADARIKMFDVRLIGLLSWVTLDKGVSDADKVMSRFSKPPTAVKIDAERLFELTWVAEQVGVEMRYVFDAQKGYCPVKLEFCRSNAVTPFQVTEVKWEQNRGVWVPVFLYQETEQVEVVKGMRQVNKYYWRRQLEFHWEKVNEPVDKNLFTLAALQVPDNVTVWDERLGNGPPIWVPPRRYDAIGPHQAEPAVRPIYLALYLVNAILILVVILWCLSAHRKGKVARH